MRRIAKVAIPTTAALGAGAVIATAAIPSSDGSINACYRTVESQTSPPGALRVVDDPASCGAGELPLSWNQKGPAGPQGATGAQGPNGLNGQNGASGVSGGGATVFPGAPAVYILEMDGIKGESNDQKHPGGIQVEDFSWGLTNSGANASGGGGGAGKVKFHDISITKPLDAASAKLFQACATGQHIKKAELFVHKAGGSADYLHITLTDVFVSSYHVGSQQPKGPGETESISLRFAKYEEQYTPTRPDGSAAGGPIGASYNVTNKKA